MSTLDFRKTTIRSARLGGESSLPPIKTKLSLNDTSPKNKLDEYEGLFVNYGIMESAFPSKAQDLYDRDLVPTEYNFPVLENEYLKATFAADLGGKLWSLIDKTTGKELLFANDVVRPCNLAVRNAWLSGGVEWNCGFKGHGPYTCLPLNTARLSLDDGTPVLRFYYFERIRGVFVQMDFFLPDGSKLLYGRMRITNPNYEVVPMYWWSNIAVTEDVKARVIVPAIETYTSVGPDWEVLKVDIPHPFGETDVTYPLRNKIAIDYFFKTLDTERKYVCQVDENGYGLVETSTARLKGRKLFVWGDSAGGAKWRSFLADDGKSGAYDEIQCGLARTQYECIPMPPRTTWEWIEGYGAINVDPEKAHGSWADARSAAEESLAAMVTEEALEKMLEDTRAMAMRPADEKLISMNGWGALEAYRREKIGVSFMCEHLDFGEITDEQKTWVDLYENGTVGEHDPAEEPISYQKQKEWISLLRQAIKNKDKDNWFAYYLLGTCLISEEEYEQAEYYLERSRELCECAWNCYALSVNAFKQNDTERELELMTLAYSYRKNDLSLAKEAFRCFYLNGQHKTVVELYESATDEIKVNERCRLFYACARAEVGRVDESEELLMGGGKDLVVPDIRECEETVTNLWFRLRELRGVSRQDAGDPPRDLDFRMFAGDLD